MHLRVRFGLLLVLLSLVLAGSNKPRLNAEQILDLVNQDRASHGLAQLNLSPKLSLAAQAKAYDMINKDYFAHQSPDGIAPWHWFKSLGYNYSYAGENLAEGFDTATELENSWMASPTHRANILSPFYSDLGLAVINQDNVNLVVQFFGSEESRISLGE